MKKLFLILVIFFSLFSTTTNAELSVEIENKLDEIYSFIIKREFRSETAYRNIRDTPNLIN